MLNPLEAAILQHGILMTVQGAPVLQAVDPNTDTPQGSSTPASWTTFVMPKNAKETGLADQRSVEMLVSFDRRTVDSRSLGVPAGFDWNLASVTLAGVEYRNVSASPHYGFGVQTGWVLTMGR